jgi:hypothetical protein
MEVGGAQCEQNKDLNFIESLGALTSTATAAFISVNPHVTEKIDEEKAEEMSPAMAETVKQAAEEAAEAERLSGTLTDAQKNQKAVAEEKKGSQLKPNRSARYTSEGTPQRGIFKLYQEVLNHTNDFFRLQMGGYAEFFISTVAEFNKKHNIIGPQTAPIAMAGGGGGAKKPAAAEKKGFWEKINPFSKKKKERPDTTTDQGDPTPNSAIHTTQIWLDKLKVSSPGAYNEFMQACADPSFVISPANAQYLYSIGLLNDFERPHDAVRDHFGKLWTQAQSQDGGGRTI